MKDKLVRYLKRNSSLLFGILFFSFLLPGPTREEKIRLMFYNAENIFDTIDSKLDDEEFLPDGQRRWNSSKYYRKLNNIYKVVVMCGGWSPPDIVGLCEVENKNVLDDLIRKTPLIDYSYEEIYAPSYDQRGIGVGLLFNKARFNVVTEELLYPVDEVGDTLKTRSVLMVTLVDKIDTLTIMVTHWPSMRGGVAATESARIDVARCIKMRINEIQATSSNTKIIIMGDFNSFPGSDVITDVLGAVAPSQSIRHEQIYNVTENMKSKTGGSYKYQGDWNMLDQIMVTGSLLGKGYGYRTKVENCRVVTESALLIEDTRYRGMKPFSTWAGFNYLGGYSDHLPIIIDLFSENQY